MGYVKLQIMRGFSYQLGYATPLIFQIGDRINKYTDRNVLILHKIYHNKNVIIRVGTGFQKSIPDIGFFLRNDIRFLSKFKTHRVRFKMILNILVANPCYAWNV